jgi:hypothetical protein
VLARPKYGLQMLRRVEPFVFLSGALLTGAPDNCAWGKLKKEWLCLATTEITARASGKHGGSVYRSPTLKQGGCREIWPRFGSTNIITQQNRGKESRNNQGTSLEIMCDCVSMSYCILLFTSQQTLTQANPSRLCWAIAASSYLAYRNSLGGE